VVCHGRISTSSEYGVPVCSSCVKYAVSQPTTPQWNIGPIHVEQRLQREYDELLGKLQDSVKDLQKCLAEIRKGQELYFFLTEPVRNNYRKASQRCSKAANNLREFRRLHNL